MDSLKKMNFNLLEVLAPDIHQLLSKEGYDENQKKMLRQLGYFYVYSRIIFGVLICASFILFYRSSYCSYHSLSELRSTISQGLWNKGEDIEMKSLKCFENSAPVSFGSLSNPWGSNSIISFSQNTTYLLGVDEFGKVVIKYAQDISNYIPQASSSCQIGVQSEDSVYFHYLLNAKIGNESGYGLYYSHKKLGTSDIINNSTFLKVLFTDIPKLIPDNKCDKLIKMISSRDGSKVIVVLQTSLPFLSAIILFSNDYGLNYDGILLDKHKLHSVTDITGDENLSTIYVTSANKIFKCNFAGNLRRLIECEETKAPAAHWTSIVCDSTCSRIVAVANRVDSYTNSLFYPELAGIYLSTDTNRFFRIHAGTFLGPIAANKDLSVLLTSESSSPELPYRLIISSDWGFSWKSKLLPGTAVDRHDYILRVGNSFVTYSSYKDYQWLKDIKFEHINSNLEKLGHGNFISFAIPDVVEGTSNCHFLGQAEIWYGSLGFFFVMIFLYSYILQRSIMLKILYHLKLWNGWKERTTDVLVSFSRGYDSLKRNNLDRVRKIVEKLRSGPDGLNVWFDEDNMFGDIFECMASAIEQTDSIIICVDEEYVQKVNHRNILNGCLYEFRLIQNQPHRMIPVVMDPVVDLPNNWHGKLGGICRGMLATDLSFDFTTAEEKKFEDQIDSLKRLIRRTKNEKKD